MKPKTITSDKAFTLIEVMVVMFIMLILILLARVAFTNPRIAARNAKRISAVNTLQAALGLYYKDQGFYPTAITPGLALRSPDNKKEYLNEIPTNPLPRTDNNCPDSEYKYTVGKNNQSYSFSACVGDPTSPSKNKLIYGTKEAIFNCGDTITDRDNFTYKTVSIGTQCWMAENLRTRTNPDGSCINKGMITSANGHLYTVGPAPDCSIYDNGILTALGGFGPNQANQSNRDCISQTSNVQGTENDCKAGYTLYKWHAAMFDPNFTLSTGSSQVQYTLQGICPDGWHIPTSDEFTTLERSVCTSGTCATDFPYDLTTTGERGTNEGSKLRLGGSSGFNALGIGQRRDGATSSDPCTYTRGDAYYWDGAFYPTYNQAGRRIVWNSFNTVNRKYTYKESGYGVRCIKD